MFDLEEMKVRHPTCDKKNGSITNIKFEGADSYFWINYLTKDTVSRTIDLLNAGPGHYLLYGVHGKTCINSIRQTVQLADFTPRVYTNRVTVTQPSCGLFNGSIVDVAVENSGYSVFKWIDNQDKTIGDENFITNLSAGTYRFVVTDTTPEGGCSDTASFTLTNQSGPFLHTNNIQITSSVCENKKGSIIGITANNVTGTPFIQWLDSLNNVVSNSLDLTDKPAGKYRLKFKDETGCDTISTPFFIIGNNGEITIDIDNKIISSATCTGNTGTIKNIKITGGTIYEWRNSVTGAVVGNSIDIINLPSGNYQLTVTNNLGCKKNSSVLVVPQAGFIPLTVEAWSAVRQLRATQ